jgi:hypothetical protein
MKHLAFQIGETRIGRSTALARDLIS